MTHFSFARRGWRWMAAIAGVLVAVASAAAADPPPNVVIVYADDLGYGDVGCFGAEGYSTPHIDSLAADGLRPRFLAGWGDREQLE